MHIHNSLLLSLVARHHRPLAAVTSPQNRGLIKRVSVLNNYYFIKAPIAQCCYVILRRASNDVKVTKPIRKWRDVGETDS